jgi:hypothetical protein
MAILIILNFLTALVAALILTWKRHPIFAAVAWLLTTLYGYGIWHAGLDVHDTPIRMLYNEERYTPNCAYPSAMGAYLALMLTNVAAMLYPWLKRWAVVLCFVFLFFSSVAVSFFSPFGVLEGLYGICCAIMTEYALMLGMTYPDVCTLEQIYLHPLLLTPFAIPALVLGIKGYRSDRKRFAVTLLLSTANFLFTAAANLSVWVHYYGPSLKASAYKCSNELQALSMHSWNLYVALNIVIFVVLFLADATASWLLYRYAKKIKRVAN